MLYIVGMDRNTPTASAATRRAQVTKPIKVPLKVPVKVPVKMPPNVLSKAPAAILKPPLKTAVARKKTTATAPAPLPAAAALDTHFLESLLGYNARRAALCIIEVFLERMAIYNLRPVDFSVLSVIAHNPGVTSRQLCTVLGILPPNFVGLLTSLEKRGLVVRQEHPSDKRSMALYLTAPGTKLVHDAEITVCQLEKDTAARLTSTEQKTLIRLLQKVYLPVPTAQ